MKTGALFAGLLLAAPASATVWHFNWTGSVSALQLDTMASDVKVGDTASASFTFDDATATVATTAFQPQATIYDVSLTDYVVSIGSVSWSAPSLSAVLSLSDDRFGQDGFTFATHRDAPLMNFQHSALGPTSALSGTSLANGFPLYVLPDQRISLFLNSGQEQENIFATATASIRNVSIVPEPEAWIMVVCGFGYIGGAIRHRKRVSNYNA